MSRGKIPSAGPPSGPPADDTGCHILHVDMDAFYVSVELRHRPELRGRPVIVGAEGNRGVVLSASYEARRDGVQAAMPISRARRLCPRAVVLAPDFTTYSDVSAGVFEVFRAITPLVEGLSLDEAFLDVSGAERRLGTPRQIGESIRAAIHDEQGITCSVGVASSKFLAKIAGARAKPDGLLVVPVDGAATFLHPLPVAALWGVGDKTEQALHRRGWTTIGDLAAAPVQLLQDAVGIATGMHLAELAWGRDPRRVVPHDPDKSIGAEYTFSRDVEDQAHVRRELLRLAEKVARRLRAQGWSGRTVSIKVRFADFSTVTRARTVPEPTDVARDIHTVAIMLYEALRTENASIRLVGIRVEQLVRAADVPHQRVLGERERGWRDAELATDRVTARFGTVAVGPATLVSRSQPTEPSVPESRSDPAPRTHPP